ncbi:hypothetical protein Fmac_026707 [Flemingia macrophylla]|uniref:Uncharacterized protein n=1 Tax=Flemingia macrophylla TaxID=520843 RepID=A0ABD1LFW8_9FABA
MESFDNIVLLPEGIGEDETHVMWEVGEDECGNLAAEVVDVGGKGGEDEVEKVRHGRLARLEGGDEGLRKRRVRAALVRVSGRRVFKYAILGDDVLITDPLVVEQYRLGLQRLGVQISTHQSLISSTGAVEFAKPFLVKDMRVNLSPVSMKALCGFHHPHGYYRF